MELIQVLWLLLFKKPQILKILKECECLVMNVMLCEELYIPATPKLNLANKG